jgi:hypothetical protein
MENEIKIKDEKNRQLEEQIRHLKQLQMNPGGKEMKEMNNELNVLRLINENLTNKVEKQNDVIKELQKVYQF